MLMDHPFSISYAVTIISTIFYTAAPAICHMRADPEATSCKLVISHSLARGSLVLGNLRIVSFVRVDELSSQPPWPATQAAIHESGSLINHPHRPASISASLMMAQ